MASFEAKKGWKTQRKRENKNCRFVLFCSILTRNRKFQKNSKIIQKYHFEIISSQNRLEKAEKETKKKFSFRSVHTRRKIENSKKVAKKFKKLKNTIMASFKAKNKLEKEEKKIK